jgi:hypothetical protein
MVQQGIVSFFVTRGIRCHHCELQPIHTIMMLIMQITNQLDVTGNVNRKRQFRDMISKEKFKFSKMVILVFILIKKNNKSESTYI